MDPTETEWDREIARAFASGCDCKAVLANPDGTLTQTWGKMVNGVFIICSHGLNQPLEQEKRRQ